MGKTDYRDGCIWFQKGYCKLQSRCDFGKYKSKFFRKKEDCSLYTLEFSQSAIMDRIVQEQEFVDGWKEKKYEITSNKLLMEISDRALGVKLLTKVLKDEWGIESK